MVITGIGAVTAFGVGVQEFWQGLLSGATAFKPIDLLAKPLVGGIVDGFDPLDYLEPKLVRQTDRFIQFALVAADEAVRMAGEPFADTPPERIGVVVGSAVGGLRTLRQGTLNLTEGGRLSPFFIPSFIPNMAAARIAMRYRLHGPNITVSTACAAGTDAVGTALDWIRSGRADVVVAGGAESLFTPEMVSGLLATRALSPVDDPLSACRPFDQNRTGMVMGEGAGVLILETAEHAARRSRPVLAQVLGYGTHGDGEHPAAPAVDGHGERFAMQGCLSHAGLSAQSVDYVNTHGTGTIVGDRTEWTSIKAVMDDDRLPAVSSIKGAIGHCLGAAGAVEAISTVLSIQHQIIPPTTGCRDLDPDCPLDVVLDAPRPWAIRVAVSNSFGFGGQNASIALGSVR